MKETLVRVSDHVYELPVSGTMHVPGRIFASENLLASIEDPCIKQVANVASLPGIVGYSFAMPDIHQGYGFPIGGVAAFDSENGIISPGGVGYDINCGVRILTTKITTKEFKSKRIALLNALYKAIPSGLGESSEFKLSEKDLHDVLEKGVRWAVARGYASAEDAEKTEDRGCIEGADASKISQKARGRGRNQLGTLGSGNHFLEIQEVEAIFDRTTARAFGLQEGTVAVMIHCGSRGLGHQTASDYILAMEKEYGFERLPDRELACAPLHSKLGKDYRAAMAAAANFAFVNRQIISYHVRNVFRQFFPRESMPLLYDIAHNIAKFETHMVNGKKKELCVHRKGATRSFGPGRKEIPSRYRAQGCPIFLPGSMGTHSYVLVGTKTAELISFGSAAHGAGRVLSRSYAVKHLRMPDVKKQLAHHDVILKTGSERGALEEAPAVYKNIDEVARVSDALGLGKLVARVKPLAVVKG